MQEHAGQRRLRAGAARAARGGGGKAAAIRPTARAKQGGVALFVEKLGPVARRRACMHALCPFVSGQHQGGDAAGGMQVGVGRVLQQNEHDGWVAVERSTHDARAWNRRHLGRRVCRRRETRSRFQRGLGARLVRGVAWRNRTSRSGRTTVSRSHTGRLRVGGGGAPVALLWCKSGGGGRLWASSSVGQYKIHAACAGSWQ